MKKVVLEANRLYHVEEIKSLFPTYFGMTMEEMETFFEKPTLIEEEAIKKYLLEHQNLLWENRFLKSSAHEVEPIIEERLKDYQVFKIQLSILSNKGRNYLMLLQYISTIPDILHEDCFYEKAFQQLKIIHFNGYMTGEHLGQLLLPMQNIVVEMQKILKRMNTLETYHRQKYDRFCRLYGQEKIYPEDCLKSQNSYPNDKTTFCSVRCKMKKKII